jgi:hypothetical protein
MIARTVSVSWQTILADLSLILFMVTASALANSSDGPLGPDTDEAGAHPAPARSPAPHPPAPHPPAPPVTPSPRAEPVGVWRAEAGAPPLPQWLNEVARDPRLRLTITVHYAPGGREAALAQALRLDTAAGPRAADARIIVEPGLPAGASAVVGFDADTPPAVAPANGTQLARPRA